MIRCLWRPGHGNAKASEAHAGTVVLVCVCCFRVGAERSHRQAGLWCRRVDVVPQGHCALKHCLCTQFGSRVFRRWALCVFARPSCWLFAIAHWLPRCRMWFVLGLRTLCFCGRAVYVFTAYGCWTTMIVVIGARALLLCMYICILGGRCVACIGGRCYPHCQGC